MTEFAHKAIDWLMDNVFIWFVLFVLLALCSLPLALFGMWIALDDEATPPIVLVADEWECAASHLENGRAVVGKVSVPVVRDVCDVWTRKAPKVEP